MPSDIKARPLFEPAIIWQAVIDSFRKLDPRQVARNPVMFVVEIGSVITTYFFIASFFGGGGSSTISEAIFISCDSIFLPRYSGVRPTMSPATNTAMIANASMP